MTSALDLRIGIRASVAADTDRFQFDFVLMTVPEPGTGMLLAVGLIFVSRVRRGRTYGARRA